MVRRGGLAGRGHPVGGEFDARVAERRGREVGERFADRHAPGGRGVAHRQRRALAERHGLAGVALEVIRDYADIGHRRLPRADELVARHQAADAAVADADEEGFVGDRGETQHQFRGALYSEVREVQLVHGWIRPAPGIVSANVPAHLRRLGEQYIHRQIHRHRLARVVTVATVAGAVTVAIAPAKIAVGHPQVRFLSGGADPRKRTPLARANRLEFFQPARRRVQRQHIPLLRFVAPHLQRRHARLVARHLAQLKRAAAAGVARQLRQRVGEAARADIVNRHNRIVVAERAAVVDDFLTPPLHFRVAALHRGEVQRFR